MHQTAAWSARPTWPGRRCSANGAYPALHRLEEAGQLASSWAQAEGRRRRVYALTDGGVAALSAQRTQWRAFERGMQSVLGWPAQTALGWSA